MPVLAIGGEKSFGTTMATVMRFAASDVREGVDPGFRPLDHGGKPDRDDRHGAGLPRRTLTAHACVMEPCVPIGRCQAGKDASHALADLLPVHRVERHRRPACLNCRPRTHGRSARPARSRFCCAHAGINSGTMLHASFDFVADCDLMSVVPFAKGARREALHGQIGMRRPARLPMHANSREASEHRPSATTSGREELADGEASLASSRAGPKPKIPRWSAERRASLVDARRLASAFTRVFRAMRLRAYVTGPPKGAAAPERLSALRFPHW